MSQRPSVGRVVHYTAPGSGDGVYPQACRAAMVTEVQDTLALNLMILNPTGTHFRLGVNEDPGHDEHMSYTWHWPERVPE